ncbi:MAG: GNAT family N-acetyltransferase [Lachnospiraceae bacterium]|nr:GNAT family N-acetyltransferase [Lachnospiraceae bacterium]
MIITGITKTNESYFLPFFPREVRTGGNDLIRVGVINDQGKSVGALSAFVDRTAANIVSLYILPDHRRQGYGRMLMEWLQDSLKEQGIEAINAEFPADDASEAFSEAMGFDLFDGSPIYCVSLGEVLRSPLYKRQIEGKKVKKAKSISSLSLQEKKILELKIDIDGADPEWSTAVIADGRYSSALLASPGETDVSIIYLDSDSDDPREVMYHIRALVFKTIKRFQGNRDAEFRFVTSNESKANDLAGLLGGRRHIHLTGYFRHAAKLL